jgi:predicted nucleic acid-binding protein
LKMSTPCEMNGNSEINHALIAASAITLNATVLSNDSHLRDYKRSGYTARATR